MGNCLVTKLKGVVDNDNLPVFNKIKLERVTGGSNTVFGINPGLTPELVITSGTLTLNKGANATNIGLWGTHPMITVWTIDGDGEGYVLLPKYETTRFYMQQNGYIRDLPEQFRYSNFEMLYLVLFTYISSEDKNEFTIQDLVQKCPNIKYLALKNTFHTTGYYSDFVPLPAEILIALCNTPYIGKTSDFGKIPTVKTIGSVNGQYGEVWDITEFVANQRSVGVITGSVRAEGIAGWNRLRFGGTAVSESEWNASDLTISWTETTITAVGRTINA